LPDGRRTKNPRILELIQFAQKCGYKKLGLAFCGGLAKEARMLTEILENKGFNVVSVRCKVDGMPQWKSRFRHLFEDIKEIVDERDRGTER